MAAGIFKSTSIERSLSVVIVSAANLKAADRGGTSDPFVCFSGSEEGKTPVIKKTLNPTWNYALPDFRNYHRYSKYELEFEVRDEDLIGSDYLGQATFSPPLDLKDEETRDVNIPLAASGKHSKEKDITGSLLIRVTLHDPLLRLHGKQWKFDGGSPRLGKASVRMAYPNCRQPRKWVGRATTAVGPNDLEVTLLELKVTYCNSTTNTEQEITFAPNQIAKGTSGRLSGEIKEVDPKAKPHRFEAIYNFDALAKNPDVLTVTWIDLMDDQFEITVSFQAV